MAKRAFRHCVQAGCQRTHSVSRPSAQCPWPCLKKIFEKKSCAQIRFLIQWPSSPLIRIKECQPMTINPLALIEKIINEHGSSAILKERLELLKDELSDLQKENGLLKTQNGILKEKIKHLESNLNDATKQMARLNEVINSSQKNSPQRNMRPSPRTFSKCSFRPPEKSLSLIAFVSCRCIQIPFITILTSLCRMV